MAVQIINKENNETENNGVYTQKFSKSFEYEGVTYSEMTFNFEELTGEDMQKVETELVANGEFVIAPEFSTSFIFKLAARAAHVASDVIEHLPLCEANKVRAKTRNFMLHGE